MNCLPRARFLSNASIILQFNRFPMNWLPHASIFQTWRRKDSGRPAAPRSSPRGRSRKGQVAIILAFGVVSWRVITSIARKHDSPTRQHNQHFLSRKAHRLNALWICDKSLHVLEQINRGWGPRFGLLLGHHRALRRLVDDSCCLDFQGLG